MFTYVCLGTNGPGRAVRFYDAVLGALGHRRCRISADAEWQDWHGWGTYERDGAEELEHGKGTEPDLALAERLIRERLPPLG